VCVCVCVCVTVSRMQQLYAGQPLTVGTACSGSDMVVVVLELLQKTFITEFDSRVSFDFLFACERDPKKQKFILTQFPDLKFLMSSTKELTDAAAVNLKTGSRCIVPYVDIYVAGFSCVSRSRLNKNASQHRGCIASGTETSGVSFAEVWAYVGKVLPELVVFENLPDLLSGSKLTDGKSDAEYIKSLFTNLGYECFMQIVAAEDYGSRTRRHRLFFMGFLEHSHHNMAHDIQEGYRSMKLGPLAVDQFVSNDCEEDNVEPAARKQKADPSCTVFA
jgi:site-specific DNA-cytosine methylase